MDPTGGKPDVLKKIDALLTRHRTAAPAQPDLASAGKQADREAIPVLTEAITEDGTIPVLTEAVTAVEANKAGTGGQAAATPDEEALRQIEEFMVRELENRIALEFTATLDRALSELLNHSHEHIRHAVREALKQRPGTPPHVADDSPDQP
jgi:hypothetical protein